MIVDTQNAHMKKKKVEFGLDILECKQCHGKVIIFVVPRLKKVTQNRLLIDLLAAKN